MHSSDHAHASSNTGAGVALAIATIEAFAGAFISYLVHAGGASPRSALLLVETAQGTTPRRFTGTHGAAPCGRRMGRAEADQNDNGANSGEHLQSWS
jgi:hypothetical protein